MPTIQEEPRTKYLSGLTGKTKERMIESVNTRHLRDFTDVEIAEVKNASRNNAFKLVLKCRVTGQWLGDYAIPALDFKNEQMSERYQHRLEHWLLEDLLISQRYLKLFDEE